MFKRVVKDVVLDIGKTKVGRQNVKIVLTDITRVKMERLHVQGVLQVNLAIKKDGLLATIVGYVSRVNIAARPVHLVAQAVRDTHTKTNKGKQAAKVAQVWVVRTIVAILVVVKDISHVPPGRIGIIHVPTISLSITQMDTHNTTAAMLVQTVPSLQPRVCVP